ncbi:unnamed protein product [Linum tenue]|uniref:Myb/SANT-like DNA-binding domain-containing protein n=1 Tax=Linum tenue TaxID=586396 RepID=A0AAV0PDU4_9ROSI|nr:unnamed protein product [Linum tenue]
MEQQQNGLPGGLFSGGMASTGMLQGLEFPLHPQQPNPQNNPQPNLQQHSSHHHHHHHHHPQIVASAFTAPHQLQPVKQNNPYPPPQFTTSKPKSPLTDDEDAGGEDPLSGGDPKRKMSPWHRMKWTDSMVRLLIMAVYYIGDEVGSEPSEPAPTTSKKKAGGAQGGLSQKKGKWKSVSRAMMEKGYYVSPQQCEDKFNDLNKRYKRVNDILGRGTACKVVENQSLLETMDLSPKMKDEVKKLLSSKHLFFREMCAYHNSCGHGNEVAAHAAPPPNPQLQQQQQKCAHSENSGHGPAPNSHEDDDEDSDDDDDDDDDEYNEEEEFEHSSHGHGQEEGDDEVRDQELRHKKARRKGEEMMMTTSASMREFGGELASVVQDGGRSAWEKLQWTKARMVELEEQRIGYQAQALEIEKQKLKWVKFAGKKEREMERVKIENERKKIENERMVLLIRRKELELLDVQHQQQHQQQVCSSRRSDPSSFAG